MQIRRQKNTTKSSWHSATITCHATGAAEIEGDRIRARIIENLSPQTHIGATQASRSYRKRADASVQWAI